MSWDTPPREHTADRAGFSEHLVDLLASSLSYLKARLELAGIEGREAAAVYGKVAVFLGSALVLALFGYILLWVGIVAAIATFAELFWGWIVIAVSILHFIAAAGFAVAARAQWGSPVFPVTMQEFRKDQEWLKKPQQSENPS